MSLFIYYFLLTVVIIHGLYFGVSGLFVLLQPKIKILEDAHQHSFKILIPARNEEQVIEDIIYSLKKQDYPQGLFEIIVIVNNCTDSTAEKSLKAGARVIECDTLVKSKGDVLKFAFKELENEKFDAYLVFDADNIVKDNFITEINKALASGYEVAQGLRDSKNSSDNWLSGSYSLYYWFQNLFFNKARMSMHGSASINGTGFMISKKRLAESGFKTTSLTEDIEYTALCAIDNQKIAFVEKAITYDEHPLAFKVSWKQRTRWTVGTYHCFRKYSLKLLKSFWKNKNISALDMFFFFMSPLIQILGFITIILLIFYRILGIEIGGFLTTIFAYNYLFFTLTYIVSLALSMIVLKYFKKDIFKNILGVLTLPFFIISWIPINILSLFKKDVVWEPIEHNRKVSSDDLFP